jgi:hypothetical protein
VLYEMLTGKMAFSGETVTDKTRAMPLPSWSYDVSADGKKFVVVSEDSQLGSAPVTLIANWTELLRQK